MLEGVGAVRVFTVGHSNHPLEKFLDLLRKFEIEVIADTRSVPKSKFSKQFDIDPLREALIQSGLRYVYLGHELGGRPQGDEFYDSTGHVLYDKLSESPLFLSGIARLQTGLAKFRVALLCAEEDPTGCHRRLLVGQVLLQKGVDLQHIRADGSLQAETDLIAAQVANSNQLYLFEQQELNEWKSIPSVSRKRRPNSFSVF